MGPTMDMAAAPQPPGPPTAAASVAQIDRPLAAVLSPDGNTVYLTAHDASLRAQLYSVAAVGGTPTLINTSSPLIHPLNMAISPDGSTLYIVDSAGGSEDAGAVYSSSTGGMISGSSYSGIRGPAGVALSADGKTIYVTGYDSASGAPGLFSGSASGGALSAVAEGPPFVGPSAVTVGGDGNVYVVDTAALGARQAAVIKVAGSNASVFTQQPLQVGFSAGISQNGFGNNDLLVTGNTGLGSGVVYQVSAASGTATPITLSASLFDPATIARAATVSKWVTVDSVIAMPGSAPQQLGQVYVLTP